MEAWTERWKEVNKRWNNETVNKKKCKEEKWGTSNNNNGGLNTGMKGRCLEWAGGLVSGVEGWGVKRGGRKGGREE